MAPTRSTYLSVCACVVAALSSHGPARPAYAWPPVTPDAGLGEEVAAPAAFPVPTALRSAVQFWRDLFLRHTSQRVVIHDRDNMEVVWRVVELPFDAATGLVDEPKSQKLVKAEVADLRERLRRLADDPNALDEEDRVVLALAAGESGRLRGASERLRTQRGVADHFQAGLSRSRQWSDAIRQILVDEGVPAEIAALPFVESMFNPLARSHAGAAGLWQLMPATARGLGLKVSAAADDRLDVLKATRAAAKMLRQNYRILGSWPLAITAYNHGPNGVRRAVDKVGSTDLMHLIENYDKSTWGFASKNFYAEFLAAMSIISDTSVLYDDTSVVSAGQSVRD